MRANTHGLLPRQGFLLIHQQACGALLADKVVTDCHQGLGDRGEGGIGQSLADGVLEGIAVRHVFTVFFLALSDPGGGVRTPSL